MISYSPTSLRIRLPVPMRKSFPVAMLLLFGYVATLVAAFALQHPIESVTGINPAHTPLVTLMMILLIPWVIAAYFIHKKCTEIGKLTVSEDSLTITDSKDKLIKRYSSSEIAFIKIQDIAFQITFRDGYRFNALNLLMPDNYGMELQNFRPILMDFIDRNKVIIKPGKIV